MTPLPPQQGRERGARGTGLTFDQIVRHMVEMGIPHAKADAQARRECGLPAADLDTPRQIIERAPSIKLPVSFVLPWSALVSDNRRHGLLNGSILLTAEYRTGKAKAKAAAREAAGLGMAVSFPVALHARVYVPDDYRAHDVPNFAKCVHDAIEGVIYTKDRWLWRATWERAGVDVDRPRAEIEVTPL